MNERWVSSCAHPTCSTFHTKTRKLSVCAHRERSTFRIETYSWSVRVGNFKLFKCYPVNAELQLLRIRSKLYFVFTWASTLSSLFTHSAIHWISFFFGILVRKKARIEIVTSQKYTERGVVIPEWFDLPEGTKFRIRNLFTFGSLTKFAISSRYRIEFNL